jgi:hypothetical protein
MCQFLIAIEISIAMRLGSVIFKGVLNAVLSLIMTITPCIVLLPVHFLIVYATPATALSKCVYENGAEIFNNLCWESFGFFDIFSELCNPERIFETLHLIQSSLDLTYNKTAIMIHSAFIDGVFPAMINA